MYSIVTTAILQGIDSLPVCVEADVSDGLPVFEMVGFLASEVRESKERVRTALRNCGHQLPAKRITINLSPSNIRKSGNGFDLPITVFASWLDGAPSAAAPFERTASGAFCQKDWLVTPAAPVAGRPAVLKLTRTDPGRTVNLTMTVEKETVSA